jgi:hypothetical protein
MAQTFYGESLTEASTTGTAWVDNASVAFTPDDNSTYFYFQSSAIALTGTASDGKHRFLNSTSSLVFGAINAEAKDATDYVPAFAAAVESFTTGHGTQTLKSQISSETAGTNTKIKEDRIVVLKKGDNDDHAVSAGDSTTTSSAYQDKISKSSTPATAGDYLIIAFCDRRSSATGINTTCCLVIDGTIYGEAAQSVADLNTYRAWGAMVRVNLTAAAHTIKLKFKSNGTATATVNNAVVIILRLSDFTNSYYAEDLARETVTTSTFTTQASLTVASPANQEHVVFACAQYDHGGTTTSTSVRFQEVSSGTVNLTEILEEPVNSATNNILCWFVAYRKTLAAESHTWNIQHHNESGTIASGLKDKTIAVLQTGGSSSVTRTASLEALLEKQGILRTASANASLQKQAITVTASIGSALSKTISPTSSLGAALLKQGLLRTTVANALAQKQGLIRTTSVDAALAKAFSAASSLNSILQKTVLTTVAADSLLQKDTGRTTSAQALLEKRGVILASALNAAVQKTTVLTASLNAVLNGSVTPQVIASVNALLQKLVQANASLNTLLSKQGIVCVASANAALQKAGIGKVASASAVLSKTASLNASLSAIIQQSLLLNAGLSAVLQKPAIPLAVSADGLLERRNLARTASLQAVLQKNIGAIAMLNAVLQKRMTATAQANGLALKPGVPVIAAIDGVIVVFEALTAHHMVTPAKQTYPRSKPKQQPTKPIRGGLVRPR